MRRRALVATVTAAVTTAAATTDAAAQSAPDAPRPLPPGPPPPAPPPPSRDRRDAPPPGARADVPRVSVVPVPGDPSPGAARPVNLVTGWIDASTVYGVDSPTGLAPASQAVASPASLREPGTGRLRVSTGNNLPIADGAFLAGDPRASENPDLTAMHVLLLREHNWHADRLAAAHPQWALDRTFQMARAIVSAEVQQVTYAEFLPMLLGPRAIPPWRGYRAGVDPTLSVEFAVAAMRFGHSIVSNRLARLDEAGHLAGPALRLRDAFHLETAAFAAHGGADGFLRHLCSEYSNPIDTFIVEDLRNFLNDPPVAIDLAAIDIQRARDTGLAPLNSTRAALGLHPYRDFAQLAGDAEQASRLASAYGGVDEVELWIGGLAERKAPGALVGETFFHVLVDQFTRLRDADRFWWENLSWDASLAAWIRNTTLADLVVRNTDTRVLQPDAFQFVERTRLGARGAGPAVVRPDPHRAATPPLPDAEFRSFGGAGNASATDARNAVGQSYRRIAPARFTDGVHAMPTDLPHPRTVSNRVSGGRVPARPERASAMLYAWGQFLSHDLTLEKRGTEDASMSVPAGDPVLAPGTIIPMRRVAWVTA